MLDVPHYRQARPWSCGPACVRMVLKYYGEEVSEQELIEELGTNSKHGTSPDRIARYFKSRGFTVSATTQVGRRGIARLEPVLVAYQDHGPSGTDYSASWDHGHYAVFVGAENGHVYLADPSSKRARRRIKTADFLARWHDIDAGGKIYHQWGLAIGQPRRKT